MSNILAYYLDKTTLLYKYVLSDTSDNVCLNIQIAIILCIMDILFISWRSLLLEDDIEVPEEKNGLSTSHWQTEHTSLQ